MAKEQVLEEEKEEGLTLEKFEERSFRGGQRR